MNREDFFNKVREYAVAFGMLDNDSGRKKKNVVIRKNIASDSDVPYFGLIRPEEQQSGSYSDFSLVFFPSKTKNDLYLMSLGVGSEGFRNDYTLASQPGLRRLFLKLLPHDSNHAAFCKPDFLDIESPIKFEEAINDAEINLERYKSVLQIGCLIDATEDKDLYLAKSWIAQYAYIRNWWNKGQKTEIDKAINAVVVSENPVDDEKKEKDLLNTREFVVLQGAPGTGKTFLANKIGKLYDELYFIQFHGETTYSDFVEGFIPKLNSSTLEYERKEGVLVESIKYANQTEKRVLLIIDEINRANLSVVLGPVFYLFENTREKGEGKTIKLGDMEIDRVPKNLHVLATMNTADRSIAVVDFALRRRFAWYTIEPRFFGEVSTHGQELFNQIANIFERHATDSELNLQPGGKSSETFLVGIGLKRRSA